MSLDIKDEFEIEFLQVYLTLCVLHTYMVFVMIFFFEVLQHVGLTLFWLERAP